MKAVIVNKLIKIFDGFEALKGISFEVEEGDIFALVGPNGAGKTTTFRIISTLLLPTYGKVNVFNYDVVKDSEKIRKIISYLPEDAGVYKNITGYEFLELISSLYFKSEKEAKEALELGIDIANLGNKINEKMKNYSKGMKRRIHVARILMVKPKLAILDEPTSGLDLEYSYEIRKMIVEFKKKYNMTVLVSSHNMREVEFLCNKIAIIKEGKILEIGKIEELLEKYKSENVEDFYIKLIKK